MKDPGSRFVGRRGLIIREPGHHPSKRLEFPLAGALPASRPTDPTLSDLVLWALVALGSWAIFFLELVNG